MTFVFVKSMNPDQKKRGDQELQNVLTSVVFLDVPAPQQSWRRRCKNVAVWLRVDANVTRYKKKSRR